MGARDHLRLTVLGCSTASPHPAWPASGYLLEWGQTTLLLDVGQGVVRRLQGLAEPTALDAVVVGHMHADHYLDLVALRYLFPWGARPPARIPVHLPPGGRSRIDSLATAISERPGFFEMAFSITEYDPDRTMTVGPLVVRFIRGRHYVPAWGIVVEAPDGARVAYTGDTGPDEAMTEAIRDVDLLLIEAALARPADDDPERGHLTAEEAIAIATRARVGSGLLVHYAPSRRTELEATCGATGSWMRPAEAGLTVTVEPRSRASARPARYDERSAASAASARAR
jgi:ribonuclease BN (tRNA processing enzyme)